MLTLSEGQICFSSCKHVLRLEMEGVGAEPTICCFVDWPSASILKSREYITKKVISRKAIPHAKWNLRIVPFTLHVLVYFEIEPHIFNLLFKRSDGKRLFVEEILQILNLSLSSIVVPSILP